MFASHASHRLFRRLPTLGLVAAALFSPCRATPSPYDGSVRRPRSAAEGVTAETGSGPPKTGRIVDGIVGKVNGEPVFLRDLRADYWLAPGGGDRDEKIRDRMGRVIDRKLLIQEAERLKMGSENPEELPRQVQIKMREVGPKGGLSRQDIEQWVAQDLAIRVLKEKRIGLLVVVSDAETESYYTEHAREFGGAPLEGVRSKVVDRIYRKKFEEQVERWFTSLKRRSQVEIFLDEEPWKTFDFGAYFQSGP